MQVPAQFVCPLAQQMPLEFTCPTAQQRLLLQFPLRHWALLLLHEPPFCETQVPLLHAFSVPQPVPSALFPLSVHWPVVQDVVPVLHKLVGVQAAP
jgi:hypothetical protein